MGVVGQRVNVEVKWLGSDGVMPARPVGNATISPSECRPPWLAVDQRKSNVSRVTVLDAAWCFAPVVPSAVMYATK